MKQSVTIKYLELVNQFPDGISLTDICCKLRVDRLRARSNLKALLVRNEISKDDKGANKKYYPFNGKPFVERKNKKKVIKNKRMLTMKDFNYSGSHCPFIAP